MSDDIMRVAFRHAAWVAARRTVIAANVANANTPGYVGKDIVPFAATLDRAGTHVSATDPRHLPGTSSGESSYELFAPRSETLHSGNTVTLDAEMMKASEIAGEQALNAAVVKAYHRLILTSAKG